MPITLDGTGSITGLTTTGISAVQQLPAGSVLQVVQVYDTTSRSTTSAYPVASGVSASITPKFATSKILVSVVCSMYCGSSSNNTNHIGYFGIARSSTILISQRFGANLPTQSNDIYIPNACSYLDSPATTSSTTYNIYWGNNSAGYNNSVAMNDGGNGGFAGNQGTTITLMEIAG